MTFFADGYTFEQFLGLLAPLLIRLLVAIVIFVVGRWIVRKVIDLLRIALTRSHMDATLTNFIVNIASAVGLVLVVLASLNELGVNTTSAVAILGGAAVAVGLALKDQLANFAAGVMIIVFRPFKIGDLVEVNGEMGVAKEIKIVHSIFDTLDNQQIVVPNSSITTSTLVNYSANPLRRVNLTIGIGYSSDLKLAKSEILRLAQSHPSVLSDPEASVQVTNLGDSAVDITLYAWTKREDWWATSCQMTEDIKLAFDQANIEIPFPQRALHVTGLQQDVDNQQGKIS